MAPLIDLPAACQLAGVSRATLMRSLASGQIKALKVGRQLRFQQADIDAFKASRQRYAIQRGAPMPPNWSAPMSDSELTSIARELARVLDIGGAPADVEGLRSLILGAADPLFWRALARGVEVLRECRNAVELVPISPRAAGKDTHE